MRKNFIPLLFILLGNVCGKSQHTWMRSYTINDGLVCNQIKGFYQDKKGFVWILTWEGLSRHDGNTFRNYTMANGLAHPLINAIIEGQDGRLYVAENDGTIDVILNGEVQKPIRGKTHSVINAFIPEISGRILAPSDRTGINVFDEGSILDLNQSGNQVSATGVVVENKYFFVCGIPSGVMLSDHFFLKQWPDSLGDYHCIMKDDNDRIWVGTTKGVRWVDRSNDNDPFELIPTSFHKELWSQWTITEMLQSSDGSIWLAANGGLIQIKPDRSWRIYKRNDGLPSENITSIFEDSSGFLWIGTDQGVAKLDNKNTIDSYTIEKDLSYTNFNDIILTADESALIIFNTNSVYRVRMNQPFQSIPLREGRMATGFMVIRNDTILTTHNGWFKIENNIFVPWHEIPFPQSGFSVKVNDDCVFSAFNQDVILSTPEGHIEDHTLSEYITALSPGSNNEIWVGTSTEGLYRAQIRKNKSGKMELEWKDFSERLPEKTIRSLHVDKNGDLWVGTRYSGLIQLHYDAEIKNYITTAFDREDGFTSDFIKTIASDDQGNIWVGSNAGIEKLIPTAQGYRVFPFSRIHNFFATVTKIATGPDRTLWFVTTSGITRIIDGGYDTISPSKTFITSVTASDTILKDPHDQLPFKLNYTHNAIEFEFASNDPVNGEQIKYSYHLAGSQDTIWSRPQPAHKVSYANLLPGNYTFEVRVLGWNGILGEKTIYHFSILPPFWKQAWFVILFIFLILALLFSFYQYRIFQLRRLETVRNRIASDLHDEIGSSLTHVNILSEIGTKGLASGNEPKQIFKRIGEEAQSSSEALDDIIWSVSSRADTAEDLISRMRRYASELFDAKGISFSFQDHIPNENQTLDLELRRDFYLVYKELLRNVIKHAEATKVDLKIQEENHFLWLTIKDNGHGFDPKAPTDRHGLKSIGQRVAKWKGHLTINSSPVSGTSIKIGLPVR